MPRTTAQSNTIDAYYRQRRSCLSMKTKNSTVLDDNTNKTLTESPKAKTKEIITQTSVKSQTKNNQLVYEDPESPTPTRVLRSRNLQKNQIQPHSIKVVKTIKKQNENEKLPILKKASPKKKSTRQTKIEKTKSFSHKDLNEQFHSTPICENKKPSANDPAEKLPNLEINSLSGLSDNLLLENFSEKESNGQCQTVSIEPFCQKKIMTKKVSESRISKLRAQVNAMKNKIDDLIQVDKQITSKPTQNQEKTTIKKINCINENIEYKKCTSQTEVSQCKVKSIEPSTLSTTPSYQKYSSLVDTSSLTLPYHYKILVKVFNSIDTVAAMLYNRKEIITFSKLKPAVQELTRKNFTLDLLAQIKTVYPEAYTFHYQKIHNFGQPDKFELVLTPVVDMNTKKNCNNTPDQENVLKSAQETFMPPSTLVERKKIFYEKILDIVRDEHEKFLRSKGIKNTDKMKITRWDVKFNVEDCKNIEKAELPKPPVAEKKQSAKQVLEMAHNSITAKMEKAMEKLAKSKISNDPSENKENTSDINSSMLKKSSTSSPPNHTPRKKSELKGIPLALLEKIRAKEAAIASKMMTRTIEEDKEAQKYSRLPEIAKILRNIFVTEKKNVLRLEIVVKKLDDSYRMKLNFNELIDHIKLICELLPNWSKIHVVDKVDYLKLAKDLDIAKVINRLEVLANPK